MKGSRAKELVLIALIQLLLVGAFFLSLRYRLGPLYEVVLIEPAGLIQQRPWMDFNGKQLKQGLFPLWNPHTGFGQPHLANIQTAVFYPLNFVVYILGSKFGYELWLFLRLWLGSFFLYLFLRKLKIFILPSLAGSFVWSLGGYGLWFMQLVELNSQILFPLLLFLFHNLAEQAKVKTFLLTILVGAVIILGGHPEPIFNSWLIGILYFMFRLFRQNMPVKIKLSRLVLLFLTVVLSASLASLVLIPFLNYYPRCWTLHYPGFGFFHLDITTIFSLFVSGINFVARGPGKLAVELLSRGASAVFSAGYAESTSPGMIPGVGLITMALTLFSLFRLKRAGSDFSFFSIVLILLLGITYGIAPFRWIAFLPWFKSASNFKFYYSEINFIIAILTALGLSIILSRSRIILSSILFLFFINLYFNVFTIKPYINLNLKDIEKQEWLKEIKTDPDSKYYRIAFIGDPPAIAPNLCMMYGLNDIASSDALFPEKYVEKMMALNSISNDDLLSYFYPRYYFRLSETALLDDNISRLADEAGIKWLVGRDLSSKLGNNQMVSINRRGGFEIAILKKGQELKVDRAFLRLKMITAQDFRLGLWVSVSGLIMLCIFCIVGRMNVKKG